MDAKARHLIDELVDGYCEMLPNRPLSNEMKRLILDVARTLGVSLVERRELSERLDTIAQRS